MYLHSADLYTWVSVNGDEATIGFTPYACERMEEMVAIELKQSGEEIRQSEPCGSVDVMKALIDIPAPISGTVLAVNQRVIDNPDLSKEDAHGDGWLLKVRPGDRSELDGLLSAAEYDARAGGQGPEPI